LTSSKAEDAGVRMRRIMQVMMLNHGLISHHFPREKFPPHLEKSKVFYIKIESSPYELIKSSAQI